MWRWWGSPQHLLRAYRGGPCVCCVCTSMHKVFPLIPWVNYTVRWCFIWNIIEVHSQHAPGIISACRQHIDPSCKSLMLKLPLKQTASSQIILPNSMLMFSDLKKKKKEKQPHCFDVFYFDIECEKLIWSFIDFVTITHLCMILTTLKVFTPSALHRDDIHYTPWYTKWLTTAWKSFSQMECERGKIVNFACKILPFDFSSGKH